MFLKGFIIRKIKYCIIVLPKLCVRFFQFIREYYYIKKVDDKRFTLRWNNVYPCLSDKVVTTPFDHHYTYHPAWAARVLATTKPSHHIDISSILSFSTIVSAFIPTTFYDYRPAMVTLSNFESKAVDLINLPFASGSINSLSCMHTIEHIGLGRYGDPLLIDGDIKAINELKRVTASNGTILFVTPVGIPTLAFNAHRIYSYEQIISYFAGCTLKEFALIPDNGGIINDAAPSLVIEQHYGCGCFWFVKN